MVVNEGVIWAVPEAHRASRLIDLRFVSGSAQEVQQGRQESPATRPPTGIPPRLDTKLRSPLARHLGNSGGRGGVSEPTESLGEDIRGGVVVARRNRRPSVPDPFFDRAWLGGPPPVRCDRCVAGIPS